MSAILYNLIWIVRASCTCRPVWAFPPLNGGSIVLRPGTRSSRITSPSVVHRLRSSILASTITALDEYNWPHFPDLQECYRVLKPGAHLLLLLTACLKVWYRPTTRSHRQEPSSLSCCRCK